MVLDGVAHRAVEVCDGVRPPCNGLLGPCSYGLEGIGEGGHASEIALLVDVSAS